MMVALKKAVLSTLILVFCALEFATVSQAHALQPGYLELRLLEKGLYAVTWKTPASAGRPMAIAPGLPVNCDQVFPGEPAWDGNAYVKRWTVSCPGGLEGRALGIKGLDQTSTDVLVRFDFGDGTEQSHRLTADAPSFTVPTQPSHLEVIRTYTMLGVEHILFGIDHLLFVLALLLLVKGFRRLVATVTAFTLAHSLTLAGATLGVIHMPGPPIEAAIALSIVFVAAEIVRDQQGKPGLTQTYPWLVAFTFGLLHGFGFAGALSEIGLPPSSIPSALLFFNVGVEIGQILFIAGVFALTWIGRQVMQKGQLHLPNSARTVPPYLIGSLAIFWMFQRIAAF